VQKVVNTLKAKVLQGQRATLSGLVDILSEPTDVVWFATHGNEDGILMLDGILNASELTTLVRFAGASLVVLNTCSSEKVARTIYNELQVQFICTIRKVPDRSAFVLGSILARKIAEGHSYREAYELAKPGQNSTYLFLPEREKMDTNQYDKKTLPIPENMNQIVSLVNRLQILVIGSTDYGVEGLIPTVKQLKSEVGELALEVARMRQNQVMNRRVLAFLVLICVLLLISVIFLIYRLTLT
jgi:hypothetical protein